MSDHSLAAIMSCANTVVGWEHEKLINKARQGLSPCQHACHLMQFPYLFSCGALIVKAISPLREKAVWPRETMLVICLDC